MNLNDIQQHVHHWVENVLSVPSPLFNNFPPCPYSRAVLVNNKMDICWVHGDSLLSTIDEVCQTWDDSYEMIMVACQADTIGAEKLADGIEKLNNKFEVRDLAIMFDHPMVTNPKHKVTSSNGKYVLTLTQRVTAFTKAAKSLYGQGYAKPSPSVYLTHREERKKAR